MCGPALQDGSYLDAGEDQPDGDPEDRGQRAVGACGGVRGGEQMHGLPLPAGSASGALAGGARGLVLLALLAAPRGQRGVDQAGGGDPAARLWGEWEGERAADREIEGFGDRD